MTEFLRYHGLSVAIIAIYLFFVGASMATSDETWAGWIANRAGGHADDAFGAFLIVVLSKWLREWNSAQSN